MEMHLIFRDETQIDYLRIVKSKRSHNILPMYNEQNITILKYGLMGYDALWVCR
jgi:hypothetical protein